MTNSSNKATALINLVLLVGILAAIFYWTLPVFQQAGTLKANLTAKEQEKTDLEKRIQEVQKIQLEQANSSEVAQQTELNAIPNELNQSQIINDLNALASKNAVNINSISFSIPVQSKEQVKKATINLTLSAAPRDLLTFLRGIENNSRKILVKTITVQVGQASEVERVNFNISMETYFQQNI